MDFFDDDNDKNTLYLLSEYDHLLINHKLSKSIQSILMNMLTQCQSTSSLYIFADENNNNKYDSLCQQIMNDLSLILNTEGFILDTMIHQAIQFGKEASHLFQWMDDTRLDLIRFSHQTEEQQQQQQDGLFQVYNFIYPA